MIDLICSCNLCRSDKTDIYEYKQIVSKMYTACVYENLWRNILSMAELNQCEKTKRAGSVGLSGGPLRS